MVINHKRVRRLMRAHGLVCRFRPRRCRTTFPGPDGYVIPDLVGRRFAPGAPNVAWGQDITYVPTGEGWLFLAGVVDLGSRRLLGYSMAEHMRTELVSDALTMAIAARAGNVAGTIAHADRGTQYTSNDYLDFCLHHQLRPSVGRTGVCWDNAVVESFWESLKRECIQGRLFAYVVSGDGEKGQELLQAFPGRGDDNINVLSGARGSVKGTREGPREHVWDLGFVQCLGNSQKNIHGSQKSPDAWRPINSAT
jgi:transposase InsO family protein